MRGICSMLVFSLCESLLLVRRTWSTSKVTAEGSAVIQLVSICKQCFKSMSLYSPEWKIRKAFFATLNNFWQFGSSKKNCSDTKSNILRFVTAASCKTNAYALPQSPTRGKSGQANLALSLMSIKDALSPPNNLTETSLNNNTKETKDNALDDVIQV